MLCARALKSLKVLYISFSKAHAVEKQHGLLKKLQFFNIRIYDGNHHFRQFD